MFVELELSAWTTTFTVSVMQYVVLFEYVLTLYVCGPAPVMYIVCGFAIEAALKFIIA